jgi:hypothetical protein
MTTSILKLIGNHLKKIFLASFLFAISFANAQTGNAINGYAYLGSCNDVNGVAHHYYLSNDGAFWPIAKANALALGGYLATLTTAAENQCVTNYAVAKIGTIVYNGGGSYQNINHPWIGYTDDAAEGTTERNWVWTTGEQICSNFTNWDLETPEPNNFPAGTTENYATLLLFAGSKLGKWNDWFNDWQNRYIVEFGPNVCNPPVGNQGCSLGYWKNHEESWAGTGFTPGQSSISVFSNVSLFPQIAGDNLMQTLNYGGGPGNLGAAKNLLRQATAAVLNAAHNQVNYPLTVSQVQSMVNAALSQNKTAMVNLASALDTYNNLHGTSLCAEAGTTTARTINPLTEVALAEKSFAVSGFPNPSRTGFTIQIDGASTEKASIKVTDLAGRLIETRSNVAANQVLKIGDTYKAGMYYVEVTQGASKKQLKMVKQ